MSNATVVVVTSGKGGVGKTTTAVNLAAGLAEAGKFVLLVDLDPQGNATSGLGLDKGALERTVRDVIMNQVPLSAVVQPTETKNLFIVPATPELANTEVELASAEKRFSRLKLALEGGRKIAEGIPVEGMESLAPALVGDHVHPMLLAEADRLRRLRALLHPHTANARRRGFPGP